MPRPSKSRSRSRSPSPRKMSIGVGYCVKCKAKRRIENPKKAKTKNGRNMIKGKCGKCDTKMCRFVPA